MLRPCSSEIDDGLSLARQYGGRGPYLVNVKKIKLYCSCMVKSIFEYV